MSPRFRPPGYFSHIRSSLHPLTMNSVISKRGKKKLVHENHIYLFSKRTADDVHAIWVCEKRSTCKGRVWTRGIDGEVVHVVNPHNHAAQAARPEAVRLANEVTARARTTQETPQQILTEVISGVHANVGALLPRKDSLKRTIRSARRLGGGIPKLPKTCVDQLVIPQEINIDGVQQRFLLHDSGKRSTDENHPDYVPNIFSCAAPQSSQKQKKTSEERKQRMTAKRKTKEKICSSTEETVEVHADQAESLITKVLASNAARKGTRGTHGRCLQLQDVIDIVDSNPEDTDSCEEICQAQAGALQDIVEPVYDTKCSTCELLMTENLKVVLQNSSLRQTIQELKEEIKRLRKV